MPTWKLVMTAPPLLSEPQSKERRTSGATMRRAHGAAGRPRAASRAQQPTRRCAQAASSIELCSMSGGAGSGGSPDKSGGASWCQIRTIWLVVT